MGVPLVHPKYEDSLFGSIVVVIIKMFMHLRISLGFLDHI